MTDLPNLLSVRRRCLALPDFRQEIVQGLFVETKNGAEGSSRAFEGGLADQTLSGSLHVEKSIIDGSYHGAVR